MSYLIEEEVGFCEAEWLYEKHLKPFWLFGRIFKREFRYDVELKRAIIVLKTITGRSVKYEMLGDEPVIINFKAYKKYNYHLISCKILHPEMHRLLKKEGLELKNKFIQTKKIK